MDRCRDLGLHLYMGCIYGGLLYFLTDFSICLVIKDTKWNTAMQSPRYCLASCVATILYISSIPFLKWSMAKDQYRSGPWKLSASNNLFFSAVLPLATFTCTEGFGFWLIGPDPLVEKRFHTLIAHGFCMTMIMECTTLFQTYRIHYLQDLVD